MKDIHKADRKEKSNKRIYEGYQPEKRGYQPQNNDKSTTSTKPPVPKTGSNAIKNERKK